MKLKSHSQLHNYVLVLVLIPLLSSCVAFFGGSVSSSSFDQPVIYKDLAVGSAQATHLFGFGGNQKDALTLEAKREMYKARPLASNEGYANFTSDIKYTYWPFFTKMIITVSADVISYETSDDSLAITKNYQNKVFPKSNLKPNPNYFFNVGDSVIFNISRDPLSVSGVIFDKGIIISKNLYGKAKVLYKSKLDNFKTTNISAYRLYTTKKNYGGHEPGKILDIKNGGGKIIAVGINKYVVLEKNGVVTHRAY